MPVSSVKAGKTEAMRRYVALLRGVNLGGYNRLPMKELSAIFEVAGCGEVQTYIQSGNVVFSTSPQRAAELSAEIEAAITKRFGFSTPVILRSAEQIGKVLRSNPFLEKGVPEEETLHVMFLAGVPKPQNVTNLDANRSPGDTFLVSGQEIYLHLPNGVGRSKLTNAYFDSKLAIVGTQRNWRTVNTLYEMCTASKTK